MNLSWKILLFVLFVATIFSSGMYTEHKFHLADEVAGLNKEVKNLGEGQNEIIKFNQELENTDAKKDPCYGTKLPDSAKRLLK